MVLAVCLLIRIEATFHSKIVMFADVKKCKFVSQKLFKGLCVYIS